MRLCAYCTKELKPRQKRYCSPLCSSLGLRGSGSSHIRVMHNGRREYLHRIVFEQHFRALEPGEIVHHKDENRHNNSPENLEALSGHAAHLHAHDYYRGRKRKKMSSSEIDAEVEALAEFGF